MGWDSHVRGAIDNCTSGRSVQDVVRNGCTVEASGREERVHVKRARVTLGVGVEVQMGIWESTVLMGVEMNGWCKQNLQLGFALLLADWLLSHV